MKHIAKMVMLFLIFSSCISAQERGSLSSKKKTLTSEYGEKLELVAGYFTVPESRKDDMGRDISIYYYKVFSSSPNPGPAIFLLAGGPGASWISSLHREERFKELNFYRKFSDVVIVDQRGAGQSKPNLKCKGEWEIPFSSPLTPGLYQSVLEQAATHCQEHWEEKGINLSAYNTDENAADIEELRKALGYNKMILVGGSYGSHLGLHMLRKYPQSIDRALFYGIEGPDHTWDVPSYKLQALKRIAEALDTTSYCQEKLGKIGLINALSSVIDSLKNEPFKIQLKSDGKVLDIIVTQMVVQMMASYQAQKRDRPIQWADFIIDMYHGNYVLPGSAAISIHSVSAPNAMSNAMDYASGISQQRYELIKSDPAQSILGDINLPYRLDKKAWGISELGPDFQEPVQSDLPILLVHGTWDISTPIENARETIKHLPNGHLIEVVDGTHGSLYELYEYWPEAYLKIGSFLEGKKMDFPAQFKLPAPYYPQPMSPVQEELWDACKEGDVNAVKKALANGANPNLLDTRRSKNGRRPLNWAAYYGHLEIIIILIDNGAEIDGQNLTGFTALHHAVEKRKAKAVKLLLEKGANQNLKNKRGLTPLELAEAEKHRRIAQLFK